MLQFAGFVATISASLRYQCTYIGQLPMAFKTLENDTGGKPLNHDDGTALQH